MVSCFCSESSDGLRFGALGLMHVRFVLKGYILTTMMIRISLRRYMLCIRSIDLSCLLLLCLVFYGQKYQGLRVFAAYVLRSYDLASSHSYPGIPHALSTQPLHADGCIVSNFAGP